MDSREIEVRHRQLAVASHGAPARNDTLLDVPWSYAARRPDGALELQLSGVLPAEWSLHLTRALAWRGASIQTGYARRLDTGTWLAELMVDDRPGARLDSIDFLTLAALPHQAPRQPEPQILDFEIEQSPAHGGALTLEVHAWDGVGLLTGVLGRAAAAGLLAVELILETEEDCAFHHLALVGSKAGAPDRRRRRALALGMVGLLAR